MKRMLSVALIAFLIVPLIAIPGTNADLSRIKVVPYPKTAGKMASYQISFNVSRPLSANQDSITVTLPNETTVPDYVSSSVISVNPKKLIGADYKLNFATGDITFTNPLREGDTIRAAYTYEAKEDYTMMPIQANVKFFDRSFINAPLLGDPRNNNGSFDPGEWVYEDRDNNGRISPGDRRLMVIRNIIGAINISGALTNPGWPEVVLAAPDAKQNSIVAVGDGDCGDCGGNSTPSFPLQPLSIIKLTMVDINNDGIYNEGDYLFDDRDQSGTVSLGDNMIAGIAYLIPGSKVEFNDPDYRTRINGTLNPFDPTRYPGNPGINIYRHVDNGVNIGAYDPGEAIYQEVGVSNYSVDVGDIRLTSVTIMRSGILETYPVWSTVFASDADVGARLIDFKTATGEEEGYLDLDHSFIFGGGPPPNNQYDPGEPIYRNGTGRTTFLTTANTGTPEPGDIRLSAWSLSAYPIYSVVNLTDADLNSQLASFNTTPTSKAELFVTAPFGINPVFSDYTGCAFDNFATVLPPFTSLATFGWWTNWIYRDMDGTNTITPGDVRLTTIRFMQGSKLIEYSAGSSVKVGELDYRPITAAAMPIGLIPSIPPFFKHSESIKSNNEFDTGEYIYGDSDNNGTVSAGDIRYISSGVTSFGNKPIGNNFPLLGHTLTRGWARIENKVIVPYAQAGTKTAKLDANPLVILPTLEPPMPPAYLKATPLILSGGTTPLSGSGKWYIKVAAVNVFGEGEPSDAIEINMVSGNNNAVEISWKPVPYAISYRIYKSKNDSYFPPSSFLAEIESPYTTYIDRGTQITEGTLPFPYRASFVTLWRNRGGTETELVEYRCADYEVDLATGLIKFRRALRPYEIILANYKYADGKLPIGPGSDPCNSVGKKDKQVYVDTVRGIGKLSYTPVVDPSIDPLNYCFRLWRAPSIDPNNPYLLRQGSDYTINYATGEIKFSSHVVKDGDIITADYDTYEEVVGESLVEAISTGISEARAMSPILPAINENDIVISKAVALKSSPQIKITTGAKGYELVFTTPVDIFVDPDNNPTTPDVVMTLNRPGRQFNTTTKGAVRNPEKAGSYQLWVQTSAEQTPIMSEPYDIVANKIVEEWDFKIISPQVPTPNAGEPPCTPKDAAASAGQETSIVVKLSSGLNGIPGVYVKFDIIKTVEIPSGSKNTPTVFTTPNLVQTTDQGLASAVLYLSGEPGITEVKIYLQDNPSICRSVRIHTGTPVQIDKILISPGPTISLAPNSQQPFTAKAFNAQGAEIQGITFTWAADCGTITPAGVYTAPQNSGSICHVYARAYGKEGMCTINMVNRPSRIVVTPPSATVATSSTLQFSAQAYDDLNNPMSIPITWTVEPNGLGSFDDKGMFKAGTIAGTGTVKASSAGVYGTASITVMAGGAIETVTVSPATHTMNVGDTQLFKATAKDKYGIEIGGTAFTWAVNPPDMGTISSSGLFIASKQGMCVIIAQAGDKSGTAIVNIVQITRIDIDPKSLIIEPGKTKQFTAIAYNANNQVVPGVTFNWSVNPSSIGMITQTGMFTCIGMAGQSGIVTASASGLSATAQVTIGTPDNLPPTITLVAPVADKVTMAPGPTTLSFKIDDPSGVSEVLVNAQPAINNGTNWIVSVNIANGINTFVVKAKDASANKNESTYTLTVYGAGPAVLVMKIPTNTQAAIRNVTITENSVPRTVTFKTSPEIYNNSTFVGLRDLAENFLGATAALGGSIEYDTNQRKITITIKRTNGDTNIFETVVGMKNYQLRIVHPDGTQETINGTMTQAPYIGSAATKSRRENYNSTMVPMRGFVEALGGNVQYAEATRTATFTFTR